MKTSNQSFLDIFFLDLARAASATVGRVVRHNSMKGNGFMISNRLFLTNNHVIHDSEVAMKSVVEFNYEMGMKGSPLPTTKFAFSPEAFLMKSPEEDLDFTIVAVGSRVGGLSNLSDFGFCPLNGNENNYALGDFVNVIQHPGQEFKKIVLRNNRLVAQSEEILQYYAAMISGSSGAPVFNDRFEPIALHHYGRPSRVGLTKDGKPGPKRIAEGVRISAIVKRINSEKGKLDIEQRLLIETALSCPFSQPSLLTFSGIQKLERKESSVYLRVFLTSI